MKIVKAYTATLLLLLILPLCAIPCAAASETTPYNWYCKNNNTHTQPVLDSNMSFIGKYDGYYVDKNAKENDKVIYLTFDAGYENGNIAKTLDILKKHNATGAFFILENLILRAPDIVKRMDAEGHLVCNHTKSHPDMTKITDKEMFASQLSRLEKDYEKCIGKPLAKIYRPPQGRFSEQNLRYAHELGYKTVFWSFAYADWDNDRQPSPEKSLDKLLAHTHNGEVLLLHPTSATNAAILDSLLCELEKDGFRFGCLTEIWA